MLPQTIIKREKRNLVDSPVLFLFFFRESKREIKNKAWTFAL